MTLSSIARGAGFTCLLCVSAALQSNEINQRVANAYNEGIVRCSNAECARYLYACFQSYSTATLNDFLTCGTQASRLNNDEFVVAPSDQTARNAG